jgi:WD40 repeat protein
VIANGNALSLTKIIDNNRFEIVNEFHPFQKPIMRVRYDRVRQRLLAGGLDNMLKFFSVHSNANGDLKVEYKIKVPSEIFAFDFSYDGNHFAMGLNDGTLIVKSKMLDDIEEIDDE